MPTGTRFWRSSLGTRLIFDRARSDGHRHVPDGSSQRLDCTRRSSHAVSGAGQRQCAFSGAGQTGLARHGGARADDWPRVHSQSVDFEQIREYRRNGSWRQPKGRDVLAYVTHLYEVTRPTAGFRERLQVEKMKKYMNFIGEGVAPEFLHRIRRATTREEFFDCCREFWSTTKSCPYNRLPCRLTALGLVGLINRRAIRGIAVLWR